VSIPQGYEIQIRPRSGLAIKQGITLLNTPGTIDSDYRGEIQIIMINLGRENAVIKRGMRIAQMILVRLDKIAWTPQVELDVTARDSGGFGSTGEH
jgi:dUTP pyrophosphatase